MTQVFTVTKAHDAVRDIGAHFPESLQHPDPGVRFLARTGLYPLSLPAFLADEFAGGSSRFAAHDEPEHA